MATARINVEVDERNDHASIVFVTDAVSKYTVAVDRATLSVIGVCEPKGTKGDAVAAVWQQVRALQGAPVVVTS